MRDDLVEMEIVTNNEDESLRVRIIDRNKKDIYIGVCYRSPSTDDKECKKLYDTIKMM